MSFEELPEVERLKVTAQVDYFLSVLMKRYGMSDADLPEIVASLRWLKEHREFMNKLTTGGTLSLLGILMTALGAAIWNGVKALLTVR